MSVKEGIIMILMAATPIPAGGQITGSWQGRKCAVALTYDDALNVHLDTVIPLLDSLGFKATFYLPGSFPGFRVRLTDWKGAAREGHELGNHSLFHPCEGNQPGREWVPPEYDLRTYTVRRFLDEVNVANVMLEELDGRTSRTFAYPCGDTRAGDSSYVDGIRGMFVGARGVSGTLQKIDDIDPFHIGAFVVDGQSGAELAEMVQQAMERDVLLVFLFHGVGGEHSINVSLDAHRQLLYFLKDHERDIWVAPLRDIAEFVRLHGKAKTTGRHEGPK